MDDDITAVKLIVLIALVAPMFICACYLLWKIMTAGGGTRDK